MRPKTRLRILANLHAASLLAKRGRFRAALECARRAHALEANVAAKEPGGIYVVVR